MARFARGGLFVVGLLLLACAGSSRAPKGAPPVAGAASASPVVLDVAGDPNGLWWDTAASTLYLADADGNRILSWTDAGGFAVFRELPAPSPEGTTPEGARPARTGLGQLVRMIDGSFVVTRFGFGKRGDVVVVPPQGEVRAVTGLDTTRRRIGLALGSDGKLYDSWFAKLDAGGRAGAVSQLSLEGRESDVITGLLKPVGVLMEGDRLFVSDQDLGQVLAVTLASPGSRRVFASFPHPDLLAAGPAGSFFAGSTDGNLYRIGAAGEVTLLRGGFGQLRGVAYDEARQRLFVADHGPDSHGAPAEDPARP